MREIPVLFENSFCVVLNKPAGLPVQGGKGVGVSLDSLLSERITPRPLLVHRLDRDTSGVILVAKTKHAAARFAELFVARHASSAARLVKQYLGVCAGIIEPEEGTIDLDLEVRGKQKQSGTAYRRVSSGEVPETAVSLLRLELATGRTHQIRRHLAMAGYPLAGDDKYGDFSLNKKLRKTSGLKNLLLHAARLVIPPEPELVPDGLDIEAPVPEYFSRFLDAAGARIGPDSP